MEGVAVVVGIAGRQVVNKGKMEFFEMETEVPSVEYGIHEGL